LLLVGLLIGASIASIRRPTFCWAGRRSHLIFVAAAGLAAVVLLKAVWNWLNGDRL
jgi:hypothetical protein